MHRRHDLGAGIIGPGPLQSEYEDVRSGQRRAGGQIRNLESGRAQGVWIGPLPKLSRPWGGNQSEMERAQFLTDIGTAEPPGIERELLDKSE
jgi:hypothetical protein